VSPTYVFPEVKLYGQVKNLPCPECGKKLRRTRTFVQTESPFNKNAQGQPASRDEIRAKLRAEADAWKAQPETCNSCKSKAEVAKEQCR
jgi:hypothetical protein